VNTGAFQRAWSDLVHTEPFPVQLLGLGLQKVHLAGGSTKVSRSVPYTNQWERLPGVMGQGTSFCHPQAPGLRQTHNCITCNSSLKSLSALAEPKFSRNLFISVPTHPLYHSLDVKKLYTCDKEGIHHWEPEVRVSLW